MALKGNIKDFNIEEIIQFIGLGRKTGCLEIESGKESCSIYFKDGLIYFVSRTSRPDSIVRRVIESVDLPDDVKKKISDGTIFPPSKYKAPPEVTEKIKKIIIDQVTDSVADVISWPQGEFVFKSGEELLREYWGIGIDPETFINEAKKRSEVYDHFYKYVDSIDTPLRLNEKVNHNEDIILTGKEWSFLVSIARNGSVSETMKDLNITLTSALLLATSLLEKGLLEPVKKKVAQEVPEEKEQPSKEDIEKEEISEEEKKPPGEKEEDKLSVEKEEKLEKEENETNLIDELAAITGDFEIRTEDNEESKGKSNLTKQELMEILKSLKKL